MTRRHFLKHLFWLPACAFGYHKPVLDTDYILVKKHRCVHCDQYFSRVMHTKELIPWDDEIEKLVDGISVTTMPISGKNFEKDIDNIPD